MHTRSKCDVLVMIWGMVGRDAEALIPIIYLLRNRYDLTVKVRSIFESSAIDRLQPRALLTNGCTGSSQTYQITKYATERGVYTVSLHAEGMFKRGTLDAHVLGWNEDRSPTVRRWYMWNENAYRWACQQYPQFRDVLVVAGSTLHEKYRIFKSDDFGTDLLKDRFRSAILYVGWTFDRAEREDDTLIRRNLQSNREYVIDCLESIANRYRDRILIVKYHPGVLDASGSEIADYFDRYDNVLVLDDELPLYQLVILSDIVISFDSTTMIDAWLAGKPTINLYRGERRIARGESGYGYSAIRSGSLVPTNESHLLEYLAQYFATDSIEDFEKKRSARQKVIRDYIGDPTVKPSSVVAKHIYQSLDYSGNPSRPRDWMLIVKGVLNTFFYRHQWLPNIRGLTHMRKHYKPDRFEEQYECFAAKMQDYYNS